MPFDRGNRTCYVSDERLRAFTRGKAALGRRTVHFLRLAQPVECAAASEAEKVIDLGRLESVGRCYSRPEGRRNPGQFSLTTFIHAFRDAFFTRHPASTDTRAQSNTRHNDRCSGPFRDRLPQRILRFRCH